MEKEEHFLSAKEQKEKKKAEENEFKHDSLASYALRKLDVCGVCKQKYNVGERIPRILVNCGHTYCTSCLTKYYRKNRIRCPFCKKLVKHLDSVEQLPLNINLFSESVVNSKELLGILDENSDKGLTGLCQIHQEKQMHFYCSFHNVNFCRECIKGYHRDDKCCVVDLFDISKLFNLYEHNQEKNYKIIKARNQNTKVIDEFFIANS
jgi:uncharacterized protein YbaR (Trm112 family)